MESRHAMGRDLHPLHGRFGGEEGSVGVSPVQFWNHGREVSSPQPTIVAPTELGIPPAWRPFRAEAGKGISTADGQRL